MSEHTSTIAGLPGGDADCLRSVVEHLVEMVVVLNPHGTIVYGSPAVKTVLGASPDDLAGHDVFELVHPDDRQRFRLAFNRVANSPGPAHTAEVRLRHQDGSWRTVDVTSRNLLDDPAIRGVMLNGVDISARKRREDALAETAIRDSLTQLYTRGHFSIRLEEEISRVDRTKNVLGIVLCDLDNFKTINDNNGHHIGDQVLIDVAKTIKASVRNTDLVFRWGGDEMMVLVSDNSREGIMAVCERIRADVCGLRTQLSVEVDTSIGVALYPEHGTDTDELIRLADRALYIAKRGGGKIHLGDEEYHLDHNTVKVVFQPIMDIAADRLLGYEALARDPQGKLDILELFKRYNAVGQLRELKRLCFMSQLKMAKRVGLKRVFINIDFQVLNGFASIPKPQGLDVVLEISEAEVLHDVDTAMQLVQKFRLQGYKFAIDDFGAGFISLPFIAKLVPDFIKLDRATLMMAICSEQFRGFLKDLVLALHNYAREGIIAEGIETEKEVDVIKGMGISLIQGYLFGKPQELAPKTGRG